MYLVLQKQTFFIFVADTFLKRLYGLIGVYPISFGLLLPYACSIHTFSMRDSIDVLGLNLHMQVIFIKRNFQPNQTLILPFDERYTHILELPKNSSLEIHLGDILFFKYKDIV